MTRRPGLAKERIDAAAKALGEMGKGEKAPRSRALLLLPMLAAAAAIGAAVHMKNLSGGGGSEGGRWVIRCT